MASDTNSSGSNTMLSFLVGALLVAVVALGYLMYTGGHVLPQNNGPSINLSVKTPSTPATPKPNGG
jgi:hypothetical protein